MMKKEQFCEIMKSSVQEILNERGIDAELEIQEVVKSNDQKLTGLRVMGKENRATPCLYLDELYEQFQKGYPIFHMASEVANAIADAMVDAMKMDLDMMKLNEYESARNFLTIHLVGIDENQQWLADKVWEPLGDLAKVCYLDLGEREQGHLGAAVTVSHLEIWNVDKEQVVKDALDKMKKKKTVFRSIYSAVKDLQTDLVDDEEIDPEKNPYFVISNEEKRYGAAMIAIPEVLDAIGVGFGCDYYIVPSSVHEVLIIPVDAGMGAKILTQMLREINEKEVAIRDRLSDHVQYYDRESQRVVNALNRRSLLAEHK